MPANRWCFFLPRSALCNSHCMVLKKDRAKKPEANMTWKVPLQTIESYDVFGQALRDKRMFCTPSIEQAEPKVSSRRLG